MKQDEALAAIFEELQNTNSQFDKLKDKFNSEDNDVVENFVKASLNYKKVDLTKMEKGKVYVMPIKIEG